MVSFENKTILVYCINENKFVAIQPLIKETKNSSLFPTLDIFLGEVLNITVK